MAIMGGPILKAADKDVRRIVVRKNKNSYLKIKSIIACFN